MSNDLTRFASPAEQRAVTALIDELLSRGLEVRVRESGDWAGPLTTNRHEALNSCASTGFDTIIAWSRNKTVLTRVGGFSIAYQNTTEADEVIHDYTDNALCNAVMAAVNAQLQGAAT